MDNSAIKIIESTVRVNKYAGMLLELIKKQYAVKEINIYDYERSVNILTCLMLQNGEIRTDLNKLIEKQTKRVLSHY
ncbi:hypothetical protein [Sporolactobacillus terrae]|uniref:hypothetical protein n=1 Tax=Sporolactobacillus terrae TaxID=269673 RepID=UPI00048C82DD|nr:hypothetical protein [Sporolactobacillus terrae]